MKPLVFAATLATASLSFAPTAQAFDSLLCLSLGSLCPENFVPDGIKINLGLGALDFQDKLNGYNIHAPDSRAQSLSVLWNNGTNDRFSSNLQATFLNQSGDVTRVTNGVSTASTGDTDLRAILLGVGLDVPLFNVNGAAPVPPANAGARAGTVSAYGSVQGGKGWLSYTTTTPALDYSDSGGILYGELGAAVKVTENVSIGIGGFATRFDGDRIKSKNSGAQLSVRVGF